MPNLVAQYPALARYNAWMNARLYERAAELSDAERRRDAGAFFRSIHGTLNHLLLTDRAWLWRFTGDARIAESRDAAGKRIAMTGRLDQVLYADFEELRRPCKDRPDGARRFGPSACVGSEDVPQNRDRKIHQQRPHLIESHELAEPSCLDVGKIGRAHV